MRPFVIAPANMNSHTVFGHIRQRMVERLHMGGGNLQKFIIAHIREEHVPRERKIGAIQLQIEAGGDYGFIFLLHRIGQSGQIGFAIWVEAILQE